MAKFSSLSLAQKASTGARKKVVFPLPGARWNPEEGKWDGEIVDVDVAVLSPGEDEEVLRRARHDAVAAGVENPKGGEPIYDRAFSVHTVVLGLVDHDSPENAPAPFFASAAELRDSRGLMSTEVLEYLVEQQANWQDERSPRIKELTPAAFLATLVGAAGGNAGFFVGFARRDLENFTRTLAAQHLTLLMQTSDDGSSSTKETSSELSSTPTSAPIETATAGELDSLAPVTLGAVDAIEAAVAVDEPGNPE